MTARHEVEVDTRIAAAHEVLDKAHRRVVEATRRVETARPTIQTYRVEALAAEEAEARAEYDSAESVYAEVVGEFEGWSRFFLVTNSGGHIHSSLHCSTCQMTTRFAWLPTLSGLDEAAAVEEYGGILCSVCFPSAPVEWTDGENKKDAEQAEADRAERAFNKTPEGRAVRRKTDLVSTKGYRLADARRTVESAERATAALASGDFNPEARAYVENDALSLDRKVADLAKAEKALARAEAALAVANEAAEAAR